jgi:hypothetical protein
VFRFTFTAVARIPFKANNVIKVNHRCMLQAYTEFVNLGFVSRQCAHKYLSFFDWD